MRKIEFWYSIGSTYTYLSTQRLAQIETENEVIFEYKINSKNQKYYSEKSGILFKGDPISESFIFMFSGRVIGRSFSLTGTSPQFSQ